MDVVIRLLVIVVAFFVAALVAGAVLAVALLFPALNDLALGNIDDGAARIVLTAGLAFISGYALLPAILLIAIAEAFSIRTVLYYAVAGAIAGLAIFVSLGGVDPSLLTVNGFTRRESEIMIGAGIVGGIAYWLIAGRRAGAAFRAASAQAPQAAQQDAASARQPDGPGA